jgi:hypothetical protein
MRKTFRPFFFWLRFFLLYTYCMCSVFWRCLFHVHLFVCFELSGDCHHCRRQGCKFRPMLSAYGF